MNGMTYELDTPVTFDLDDASRDEKVNQFIEWVYSNYGSDMYEFFKENHDAILENKLQKPWGEFPAGMKLSKVLMREFGLDAEEVRQRLSMLIQSNKVTGKLCLSVHPLDFLSASENNHSWRSCHALDGEYRSGNVSYMVDNCTIMAYLKSDAPDTELPRFPADVKWNDKKWRCYFFIDHKQKYVYAGRQYPFFSHKALELVADMFYNMGFFDIWRDAPVPLAKAKEGFYGWGYSGPFYRKFHHWAIKGPTKINEETIYFGNTKVIYGFGDDAKIVPLKKYVGTHNDAMCYNDLIDSHTYAPWILGYSPWNDEYYAPEDHEKFLIGAPTRCVCCGDHLAANSDTFVCRSCDHEYRDGTEVTCAHCGCILDDGEGHDVDGDFYCDDCYRDLFDR